MSVECFFVVPTMRTRRSLRRYSDRDHSCGAGLSYHNADGPVVDEIPDEIIDGHWDAVRADNWPHDDPRWPGKCDACEYRFVDSDPWQVFHDPVYVDAATGVEYTLRASSRRPGMMWDAFWMGSHYHGPDGRCLVVVCPSGNEWMIDGPASNCTTPQDREHRCWTRTGAPPRITVGKEFGKTCAAGGGSIQAGNYHGFLREGRFT